MNLVIDIGNTAAKIAVFDKGEEPVMVIHDSNRSLRRLKEVLRHYPVDRGIISSVVELSEEIRSQIAESGVEFLGFDARTPVPVTNLYRTPQTLGADRLAAVVGAHALCPGRDILVIDAGTCITYDFVDAAGNYRGGNISPGVKMRLKALNAFTDRLPLIEAEGESEEVAEKTDSEEYFPWGVTTETAIRGGVKRGVQHEIEGYIRQEQKRYPRLFVFLTGGDGLLFDAGTNGDVVTDRHLVLKGLNRILEYNIE